MIEKGETNWDMQYDENINSSLTGSNWNAGNSATAGREAAAVINYGWSVASATIAHAF